MLALLRLSSGLPRFTPRTRYPAGAALPGRGSHPRDCATLPGRTVRVIETTSTYKHDDHSCGVILIRFQNETNYATLCSWQDQGTSTQSWCRELRPLSRKLRICKSCERPRRFFFRLYLEPRWNRRHPCSGWGAPQCPGCKRGFANGAARIALCQDGTAGGGTY